MNIGGCSSLNDQIAKLGGNKYQDNYFDNFKKHADN